MLLSRILAYGVAAACALMGVLVLLGQVGGDAPASARAVFGTVLLLFAVYRIVIQRTRERGHIDG